MGKPGVGGQKRDTPGGSDEVVESRKGGERATMTATADLIEPGGAALGTKGAPRVRSGLWQRSLAMASLAEPSALCHALEERQQAHRCLRTGAQSLGNRSRQTQLGGSQVAVGHAFPRLSQHPRAGLAGPTPRVSGAIVVGGGGTGQGT